MNPDQNLNELLNETQKLVKANEVLEATIKKLQQAQEKMASSNDKLSKAYKENTSEIRKAESAIKNNTEQIEKNIKIHDSARATLDKNTVAFDKLETNLTQNTKSQKDNTESVDKLNSSYKALGKAIDDGGKSVKESGKDYEYGKKYYDNINSSIDRLKDTAGSFGPQLQQVSKGFNAMHAGTDLLKEGFKGVGSAIKATGFGLLLIVIEAITQYFLHDKIGIKRFQGGLAAIGVVVEKVKAVVQKLGGAIIEALIHPVDNIKKFWDVLVNKFSNTFSALGDIITGVFTLNPDKISHGVKQLSTEVNKATNFIKKGFNQLKKEVVDTIDDMGKAYDKAYAKAGKSSGGTHRRSKPKATRSREMLSAHAQTLTEIIQSDKKAYDQEMALLDNQLDKKLTSQAEYNKRSRELQEQYHQAIGTVTEAFHKRELQAVLKHTKQVAEEESRKKGIAYDEKRVKKAVLPWKQFEAEKKLIEDKFAFEIFQAQGNEEKIKEIKEKSQQAQTELAQKYEQQRKEFALNTAQQVADKAFSIIGSNIKAGSDAKIKGLEKDKANELSNKNLTQTQRKAIEDKYQKKEAQEKVKAFKAEQRMSVLQAVVNGALAVTKATAQTGILAPFVIPGIIASTALQIATIVAQKPPAFAKGGRYISDGRGALLPGYSRTDNTNAFLRSGEAVVVSEAMRNPWARNLVSAINVAHGGRDFSVPNMGRGYAIGGIFTDGGNANRYYNQPVNDIKDMANTLAYQMINNFPPIYVDVKDVNNQQNILAQTVNRVNL